MHNLRSQVIKLAYERKDLRPYLLPVLYAKTSGTALDFSLGGFLAGTIRIERATREADGYSLPGKYISAMGTQIPFKANYRNGYLYVDRVDRRYESKVKAALAKVAPKIKAHFRL